MGAIGFKCAGGHWSGIFISNSGEIIKTFLPTVNSGTLRFSPVAKSIAALTNNIRVGTLMLQNNINLDAKGEEMGEDKVIL